MVDLCEVCNSNEFKYKCPRCSVKSCSLQCNKLHKQELKCNGEREKVTYVPLKNFNNLNLLSDYCLLEDITRTIDICKRNPEKRYTRFQQPLPTHLYRLKAAALKRGITLQFLPQHFTRHKENTTKLNYETQIITWKIDFIFPQAEFIKISESCDESKKIISILSPFLNPVTCPYKYKNYLKFYHAAGTADIEFLLKAERVKEDNAYFSIETDATILEMLENRYLIENPIIYVIRKSYRHEFNILDDDKCVQVPFEVLHGKKSGFFGDFNPVNFYKPLKEKPKRVNKGNVAKNEIHRNAKKIKKYLKGQNSSDSEDGVCSDKEDTFNNKPRHQKNLFIPKYENLPCSSNN